MIYSPKYVQKMMDDYQFQFKKKFGQNFIIDENIINNIILKSEIDKDSLVIEVGPGSGALTNKLCATAGKVISFEIDTTLQEILANELKSYDNVKVIYEDFLKVDVLKYVQNYSFSKIYLIANLPYYITTPIIMKVIEEKLPIDKIVIMVQKEVGNRFKADIGTKDYNSLSIYLNYYFDVKKVLDVSRNVFYPKPNVDSIVVEMKAKNKEYQVDDEELLFQLIRDAFKQKRKTLRNNLKEYNLEVIEQVLKKYQHSLSTRAEQISLEEFIDIANHLKTF